MRQISNVTAACVTGLLAMPLLAGQAHAAGPAMTSRWEETELDFEACRERIAVVLRQGGFRRNVAVNPSSVFGERGNYTAMIRCVKGKGVVVFVVAGPDTKTAERYNDDVADKF